MNQLSDERKQLEWTDLFADYMITFIGQPEAFKQYMDKQKAMAGKGPMNIKVINPDAELKTQMIREGKEIVPEVDEEIRDKTEEILGRMATKKNEEFKDL